MSVTNATQDPRPRFLHVPISAELLLRINVAAASEGRTIKDYVTAAIETRMATAQTLSRKGIR